MKSGRTIKSILAALQETDHMLAAEAQALNRLVISRAVQALEGMIYKEEKILFPTALDILPEEE